MPGAERYQQAQAGPLQRHRAEQQHQRGGARNQGPAGDQRRLPRRGDFSSGNVAVD
jgi:hypothetical protein